VNSNTALVKNEWTRSTTSRVAHHDVLSRVRCVSGNTSGMGISWGEGGARRLRETDQCDDGHYAGPHGEKKLKKEILVPLWRLTRSNSGTPTSFPGTWITSAHCRYRHLIGRPKPKQAFLLLPRPLWIQYRHEA